MGKAMKAKRVSVIAKGKRAKSVVFRGSKTKTSGGLSKANLTKSKTGKIVSKAAQAHGKKAYKKISAWTMAVQTAKKEMGIKGFVAINSGAQGKALYKSAKAIYSK